MKRIILATILTLLAAYTPYMPMESPADCADVVIGITIKSADVPRFQAAISTLNCTVVDEDGNVTETLSQKECLRRYLMSYANDFVNKFEEDEGNRVADAARDVAYQAYLESHVPFSVE